MKKIISIILILIMIFSICNAEPFKILYEDKFVGDRIDGTGHNDLSNIEIISCYNCDISNESDEELMIIETNGYRHTLYINISHCCKYWSTYYENFYFSKIDKMEITYNGKTIYQISLYKSNDGWLSPEGDSYVGIKNAYWIRNFVNNPMEVKSGTYCSLQMVGCFDVDENGNAIIKPDDTLFDNFTEAYINGGEIVIVVTRNNVNYSYKYTLSPRQDIVK